MTDDDKRRLEAWLDANAPGVGAGPVTARVLSGGASNLVMAIRRDGPEVVLRRPPEKPRPDSEKIIAREARVLAALRRTDVPHPRFIAYCDDASVMGVRFYLMALVDGWLGHHETPPAPFDKPGKDRRDIGFALVDGIARLANVDYRAVGLEGFGKPEGFLDRQVERWRSQLASYGEIENYPGRDIPGLSYAADWLAANTPEASPAGIIHGDYSFANCLFERTTPARVAAMIDWELATVGDPLLDLGWLMATWPEGETPAPGAVGVQPWTGFPTADELVEHYRPRTTRDLATLDWYAVLACYKLGIILEGTHARACAGRAPTATGDRLHATTIGLFQRALRWIG